MDRRIIPVIIGAMVIIAAALGWLVYSQLRGPETIRTSLTAGLPRNADGSFAGGAVDSGARIELEVMRQQLEAMQERFGALEAEMAKIDARIGAMPTPQSPSVQPPEQQGFAPSDGPNQIIDAYAQVVLIANRRNVNNGISVATPSFLEGTLGKPRDVLSDKCESMTNGKLSAMLVLEEVGPIRVQMLQPAIDSLKRVFANVEKTDPDLYARINTAGALCVRQIRGTNGRTSTHSFGLSLDLNIDGKLDTLGDGKTQLGLTILADFFKTEGWIWGAGFSREDSMHFEVSREMVEKWRSEGKI